MDEPEEADADADAGVAGLPKHRYPKTPLTVPISPVPHAEAAHEFVASRNLGWLHKHVVSVS